MAPLHDLSPHYLIAARDHLASEPFTGVSVGEFSRGWRDAAILASAGFAVAPFADPLTPIFEPTADLSTVALMFDEAPDAMVGYVPSASPVSVLVASSDLALRVALTRPSRDGATERLARRIQEIPARVMWRANEPPVFVLPARTGETGFVSDLGEVAFARYVTPNSNQLLPFFRGLPLALAREKALLTYVRTLHGFSRLA